MRVVVDMCVAGYWLGGYSRQPRARRLLYPVGWGTLGYGLPAAIGPAAHGIPTLAVVGDGGAAMGLGELATYTQERLPITLLVVSDGGYGMLRYDQTVAGDPHRGVDLVEPRWAELASAFGLGFVRTDDPGAGPVRRARAGPGGDGPRRGAAGPARAGVPPAAHHVAALARGLSGVPPAAHHVAALARGLSGVPGYRSCDTIQRARCAMPSGVGCEPSDR